MTTTMDLLTEVAVANPSEANKELQSVMENRKKSKKSDGGRVSLVDRFVRYDEEKVEKQRYG